MVVNEVSSIVGVLRQGCLEGLSPTAQCMRRLTLACNMTLHLTVLHSILIAPCYAMLCSVVSYIVMSKLWY